MCGQIFLQNRLCVVSLCIALLRLSFCAEIFGVVVLVEGMRAYEKA